MSPGPLAGVRVVELAGMGPAPFACMMLAELGADVVMIDRPTGGWLGGPPEYDLLSRGRASVAMDLKRPEAIETVLALVDRADILVEGFRPGVMERLGLGPDVCTARNPRLVYGRMTGWGQDGPWAGKAGHDVNYIALTGVLHSIGPAEKPVIPLNLVGDFGGGALYLVAGVLAALLESRTSGQGQVVDAAIVDGATHLSTMTYGLLAAGLWSDQRASNLLDGATPFYDVYATSDGRHMSVGPLEANFYEEFVNRMELDAPAPDRTDASQWPALRASLAERFATKTMSEWAEIFAESDGCVVPVLTITEAAGHPHIVARRSVVEHAGISQPAPAPRFSRTPTRLTSPPPLPGQNSRDTLAAWGIEDVDALISDGIVVQAEEPTK